MSQISEKQKKKSFKQTKDNVWAMVIGQFD